MGRKFVRDGWSYNATQSLTVFVHKVQTQSSILYTAYKKLRNGGAEIRPLLRCLSQERAQFVKHIGARGP